MNSEKKLYKYDHPDGYNPYLQGYPWSIDRQVLNWVPENSSVLEFGCATGYMGHYLNEQKKCTIVGVEKDSASAQKASRYYKKIIEGDLDNPAVLNAIDGQYDVVLFVAILEHLIDPKKVLSQIRQFVKPNGMLIVTLPNVAHWSIRMMLLKGNFNYSDYGILDRTHLRFFNLKAAQALVADAGYEIIGTSIDPDSGLPLFNGIVRRLPFGFTFLKLLYNLAPNFFGYQILITAKPQSHQ